MILKIKRKYIVFNFNDCDSMTYLLEFCWFPKIIFSNMDNSKKIVWLESIFKDKLNRWQIVKDFNDTDYKIIKY